MVKKFNFVEGYAVRGSMVGENGSTTFCVESFPDGWSVKKLIFFSKGMKNKKHIMVFKRTGFIQSREIKSRRDDTLEQ